MANLYTPSRRIPTKKIVYAFATVHEESTQSLSKTQQLAVDKSDSYCYTASNCCFTESTIDAYVLKTLGSPE